VPLHRLTTITLGVPDVEAARAFYRDFGLREVAPGRFASAAGGEQLRLESSERRCLLELGLAVDAHAELDPIAERLDELGAQARLEEAELHAVDPGTETAIVVQVTDRVAPRPLERLATNAPGRSERVGARSGAVLNTEPICPSKLGHVVLASPDPERSIAFFRDGLGFEVSDESAGAVFMRCSSDHHNLLVQPGPFFYLHHIAWEMADLDQIGLAARCLLENHPESSVWGPGRHGIGSNYFWYVRDPAGNFLEYYADMDVIEDADAWKPYDWSDRMEQALAVWGPPAPPEFFTPPDMPSR
jgi:catechol 2,3-dioxygenase-like lactoylglutathione lyase family enzyme